ncbi:hypothetical protein [Haloflavibacter putidus]|uniref:Rieske domain-containing protein n=1 Tax=Haloflavibacter putidus TaxID=2576776 RepID=A0A507ZUM8_9FLAO|nr:hypothetical protein [Haloflavibacter putidus]TQD38505.1 hypothetical protein FKR84_08785 [Haloflavibacter putidus]
MKVFFSFAVCLLLLYGCSSDDNRISNPNLLDVNVNLQLDLSLPQYNSLNFVSSPVYIANYGNGGIYVMNTGGDAYVAYDGADPNHPRDNNCPAMQREGIKLICDCEGNTYNLFTGTFEEGEDLRYTLYAYRVQKTGQGTLVITN